jgi:VanZ family protein
MNDKLEHFLAYGMLAGLLYLTWWAVNPRRSWLGMWVWGVGLAYGALDEWLQALVGRDCELKDWLADALAVTIAVTVLSAVKWRVDRRQSAAGGEDSGEGRVSAATGREAGTMDA